MLKKKKNKEYISMQNSLPLPELYIKGAFFYILFVVDVVLSTGNFSFHSRFDGKLFIDVNIVVLMETFLSTLSP